MTSIYNFEVRGAARYMHNSILNIYGGKISNNEGINNTEIYSNKNVTIKDAPYNSINHTCSGAAIYANTNSKVLFIKEKYQIISQQISYFFLWLAIKIMKNIKKLKG